MPNKSAGKKAKCPECHKDFAEKYLQTHRRRAHGIYGGASGRKRPDAMRVVPEVLQPARTANVEELRPIRFKTVPTFMVLEDNEGGLWLAEKLR